MVNGKIVPPIVKPGDTIMLKQWGGENVRIKEKDYMIVNEEDILGIVELE